MLQKCYSIVRVVLLDIVLVPNDGNNISLCFTAFPWPSLQLKCRRNEKWTAGNKQVMLAGRGAVQWLFLCPGPLHHRTRQRGAEYSGSETGLLNIQDSRRRSWDSGQILQFKGVFLAPLGIS